MTMLYHGTCIAGLSFIKANAKSHATGEKVAYFTEDRVYALVCCRRPEENFVTMGIREDGKYHYYERFPNQLEVLYANRRGYLYIVDSEKGLINTKGRTWESDKDKVVERCEIIDDVYEAILEEERKENVVVHRYQDIDPVEQKMHANHIKEHLDGNQAMRPFYLKNFSTLWD